MIQRPSANVLATGEALRRRAVLAKSKYLPYLPECLLLSEIEYNSIQFCFIFRHTYSLAMHNTEVQSKIIDRK